MAKTLRIGFAMGGGVSLGTFCGSSLAQALKLLIVYGRDREGRPFERVEVDVFSGASAGSLSLAAMLRSLVRPDPAKMADARGRLKREFEAGLDPLSPEAWEDLCAAQVMQDFQELLWSKEIKLEGLLGAGSEGGLRHRASLLDRGAVDRIARDYVVRWPGTVDLTGRRILANRVLYACTLTNLTPMVAEASAAFPGQEVGFVGLNDGMRSFTHRDLRVFDLNFKPVKNPGSDLYADRWCLYHDGSAKPGLIGSLGDPAVWAKLAATAIASGAFPGAFEPVVLPRKAFEYGPRLWSRTLGRPVPTAKKDFEGGETMSFSYFDGGTLNNEPIREAFRLASFLDGHARAAGSTVEFERLIVFVDPFVSDARPGFRVPGQQQWGLDDPDVFGSLDGYDLRRLSSIERLLPHVFTLVGAVSNESRVIEADKVHQIRDVFRLRDGVREMLFRTLADQTSAANLTALMDFCRERLKASKQDEMIPCGPMTLAGELERVCAEERDSSMKELGRLRGRAQAFLDLTDSTQDPDVRLWLRAMVFVAVDLILGLEGKLEHARLVAIAPFLNLSNTRAGRAPDRVDLPGGALGGFAGFMSDVTDRIDFAAARCCTAEFLRECGLVDPGMPVPNAAGLTLGPEDRRRLEKDVQGGIAALGDRVGTMVRDARFVRFFPGLDGIVNRMIAGFVEKRVKGIDWRDKQETTCTFRIRVPNERFEFDGRGFGDRDCGPVENRDDGGWDLVTLARWDHAEAQWAGGFVKDGRLDIDADGTLFRADEDFCEIELPSAATLATAETMPNPTFFIQLKPGDKGKVLPDSRWQAESGVRSLEESLLG